MARLLRPSKGGLVLLLLLLQGAAVFGSLEAMQTEAKLSTVGASTKVLTKTAAGHLYDVLIRNGLFSQLSKAFLVMNQELRRSPYHSIARRWHTMFVYQLTKNKFPEAWKQTAAERHKSLGGEGDLLAALEERGDGSSFSNLREGPLRDEFISYALFFLKTFVRESICDCLSEPETLEQCVSPYQEELKAALSSTLRAFFEFAASRTPGKRLLASAFVLLAAAPCPFSYLTEPVFIAAALMRIPNRQLKGLTSEVNAADADACPEENDKLLRVLMANGVTPADRMRIQGLKGELDKLSAASVLQTEGEAIKELLAFGEKLLAGEGADPDFLKTAEEALKQVTSLYKELPRASLQDLLDSPLGKRLQASLEAFDRPEQKAFVNRLRTLLEGQEEGVLAFDKLLRGEAMKELAEALEAEAKDNPQGAPLRQKKAESKEEEAAEMLELVRGRNLTLSPLRPKEEKKDEKEKGKKDGKKDGIPNETHLEVTFRGFAALNSNKTRNTGEKKWQNEHTGI
ncbi:hypothetical protein Efla_000492 [Eimeria flavescens]